MTLKKLPLLAFIFFCSILVANAQGKKSCGSHENMKRMMAEDPQFAARQSEIEKHTQRIINGKDVSTMALSSGQILTIPVYVHVIYNTAVPAENISLDQIQSQIEVLNADFRKLNADVSKTPAEFAGRVADIGIQFTLAGVTRKASTKSSWGTRDAMKKSKSGGVDPISPSTHLNIWVCNIGGGILGYAQFPGGTLATDGVVIGPNYFGSRGYLSAPFNKGRTATHEVGHWLNLRHIWGDATCGNDFVTDTPAASGPAYGCPSYPKVSCSTNNMTMNYMDYTDDACMYMFTEGQKARMRAIFEPGGARASFVTSGARTETIELSADAFTVYPNPAEAVATVKVNLTEEVAELSIVVRDVQGREVAKITKANAVGVIEQNIEVRDLKAGMYFISISSDRFSEVRKLMVTK